jgi:hypothetical protein
MIQNFFFVSAKENLSQRERTSTQVVCVVAIGGNKQSTWKLRERERKRKKKEEREKTYKQSTWKLRERENLTKLHFDCSRCTHFVLNCFTLISFEVEQSCYQ